MLGLGFLEVLIVLVCTCVLILLLKVLWRAIKYLIDFFSVIAFICLCVSGCSDEGILLSEQVIESGVFEEGVVTDVPPEVWDALKLRASRFKAGDTIHALQKAYYNRYINAGGIAIVGNAVVEDKHFLAARGLILVMTSRYPALRDRLLSRHGSFI